MYIEGFVNKRCPLGTSFLLGGISMIELISILGLLVIIETFLIIKILDKYLGSLKYIKSLKERNYEIDKKENEGKEGK